ncbi:hypothetical protein ACHAXA_005136 [Cyclostephanos tholiformis]|uniref:Calcium/calmodulin-dependent protein kinase II association-domain domain-containing protein n=1 Tax=Cyclostephanos tholiformis TaxID=382380 RepID=A0ABD3RXD5_9STRA
MMDASCENRLQSARFTPVGQRVDDVTSMNESASPAAASATPSNRCDVDDDDEVRPTSTTTATEGASAAAIGAVAADAVGLGPGGAGGGEGEGTMSHAANPIDDDGGGGGGGEHANDVDDPSPPVGAAAAVAAVRGASLTDEDVIDANGKLLDAIASGDYESYRDLTSHDMTAIEPESLGQVVQGTEFHKYYFDLKRGRDATPPVIHMISPCIRWLGGGGGGGGSYVAAILSYVRLDQILEDGKPVTKTTSETRVWENRGGRLVQVHFHKS